MFCTLLSVVTSLAQVPESVHAQKTVRSLPGGATIQRNPFAELHSESNLDSAVSVTSETGSPTSNQNASQLTSQHPTLDEQSTQPGHATHGAGQAIFGGEPSGFDVQRFGTSGQLAMANKPVTQHQQSAGLNGQPASIHSNTVVATNSLASPSTAYPLGRQAHLYRSEPNVSQPAPVSGEAKYPLPPHALPSKPLQTSDWPSNSEAAWRPSQQQADITGPFPEYPLSEPGRIHGYPNLHHADTTAFGQNWERDQFWNQFATRHPESGRIEGYETLGAVVANGFAYGRIEIAFWEPHFGNNGGLAISSGALTVNEPFDFGFELTPRYVVGFETNAGPGIEINYWKFNEFSDGLNFQSDGFSVGEISVLAGGAGGARTLTASAPGERLESRHQMKIQSTSVNFFKAHQAPLSRLRGLLGFRHVATKHDLIASRNDGAGLFGNTNFNGGGPTVGIDYFRPIGHTRLYAFGGLGMSLLFGHHDQTIIESGVVTFRETATDHPLAIFDLHLGVEWRRKLSRCNSVLIRSVFESQHWIGGATSVDPNSDFGLYGFVFSAGITR